ncbi:TRAP transporter permease [Neobacillus mesonae]|uniref:TRAP transporter permease n=1 Tax=Neobacillus mesonae TaxID=1193713 RepID=UPI00203A9F43|nr:TRAP transporter permease [Neobacillus mesonae]MCM3568456.1 TRAP transporter permease [Neobacillus mesonae]
MKRFAVPGIIAIVWSLFQMYTAMEGAFPSIVQRSIHVSFGLSLAFALYPLGKEKRNIIQKLLNIAFILLPLIIGVYVTVEANRLSTRIWFVDDVSYLDFWLGALFILLLLEASRRTVGYVITLLAVLFIAYGFAGPYLGGLLSHRGLDVTRMVDLLFLSPDGIFGVPIGVATDYVFYFILFGAFLEISGGGKLFIDIAFKLTRKSKGGPAKAAVVSSGLMGSISGSAVANVVSTGIFTIPLMKKTGYSKRDAGAIEALASTGGQLMPPIMGAAAFLMAEMLGVPYVKIIYAALIPALLYYISVFVYVHLKASKDQLGLMDEALEEEKEKLKDRIHLLLPLVILIILIFSGSTLSTAAFWSIVSVLAVSYLRKNTFLKIKDILSALESGAKQSVKVTIPCAVAGIIVGTISFSGLGLKFTSIIVELSFGNIGLALILVALGCIILGMGMPTTSAYIMAAILLAPALEEFGVNLFAAHMFVFYFAVLSMITPPVALAAYSAAGISGASMNETGVRALVLGAGAFLIPFVFVLNPALLMIGQPLEIAWVTITTLLGIIGLVAATVGYFFTNMSGWIRIVSLVSAITMIIPETITDIIGILLFLFVAFNQRKLSRRFISKGLTT